MIYKTVSVKDPSIEQALAQVTAAVAGCPDGSHIRVRALVGHPVLASLEVLRKQYPKYHWAGKAMDSKDNPTPLQQLEDTTPVLATEITPENLLAMVDAKLLSMGIEPAKRQICAKRLKELVYDVRH